MAKTKKEATAEIAKLLDAATKKLRKAAEIADKFNIDFSWSPPSENGTFNYTAGWVNSGHGSCSWEVSDEVGSWDFDPEE